MIASNHRALSVLFPVSQQGAAGLPNNAGDMSNCFMILEKSDFELLQVALLASPCCCHAICHSHALLSLLHGDLDLVLVLTWRVPCAAPDTFLAECGCGLGMHAHLLRHGEHLPL